MLLWIISRKVPYIYPKLAIYTAIFCIILDIGDIQKIYGYYDQNASKPFPA